VFTRESFGRQTAVMSRLRHANIVSLLGVCSQDEPCNAVLEYARCGNLATFLRSNSAPATADVATGDETNVSRTTLR